MKLARPKTRVTLTQDHHSRITCLYHDPIDVFIPAGTIVQGDLIHCRQYLEVAIDGSQVPTHIRASKFEVIGL